MATWAKFKFFWETMLGSTGSTLTASSTATGDYAASYIYNMLETNMWKSGSVTPPATLTYDAGSGNTKTADYVAIIGHNLFSAGASVYIEWSDNGADWTEAWSATPTADTVKLAEFTVAAAHRYWRLRLYKTGDFTVAPYMTLCIWGNKTELDYASSSFDPYEQDVKAAVNLSQGGFVTGIHTQYTERSLSLTIDDADSALYSKLKAWWDGNGLKNFFVAYDTANDPTAVYLMRPDPKFSNPLKNGGLYRTISVNLKGRKE